MMSTSSPTKIRPLASNASRAVRAGQVIGTFSRAVEELTRNSASASATKIVVTVGTHTRTPSFSTSYLQVSDNGIGIDPESLRQYVGIEHCSSRRTDNTADGAGRQSIGLFTERGESVRSMAALSQEMRISTSTLVHVGAARHHHRSEYGGDKKRRTAEQIVACEKVIQESEVVSFRSSIDQDQPGSSILPSSVGCRTIDSTNTSLLSSRPSFSQSHNSVNQTGTTFTVLGLFHRYAVRRKRHEMEGKRGDAVASSKPTGLSGRAQPSSSASDRADLAQARACLRSMALAYPLITFRLVNGLTGAVDSSWESSSVSASVTIPRFDPSLPLSASFSARRAGSHTTPTNASNVASSLLRRLDQLCGDATSNRTTMACLYEEEDASRGGKNTWSVIGALSLSTMKSELIDTSDDSGRNRINRTRQLELIFINKRPARHISALADIVQNETSTFLPHSGDNQAYFVVHVTCSPRDVEMIIDENKSTLTVPQRERMERLLRKAVSSTLKNNGYRRTDGDKFDAQQSRESLRQSRKYSTNTCKLFDSYIEATAPPVGSVASSKFICGEVVVGPGSRITDASLQSSPYFSSKDTGMSSSDDEKEGSTMKVGPTASPFSDAFFCQSLAMPASALALVEAKESNADKQESDECSVSDEENGRPSAVNWTRTRVRALESQISSLAVNLDATTAVGGTSRGLHRLAPISVSLTKDMLANAQVIAQVDEKFIVIKAGDGILCCVDQHAADERIGLERLELRLLTEMSQTCTSPQQEMGNSTISRDKLLKLVPLLPAQDIPLSPSQLSVVLQHKDLLEKWRFSFKLPSAGNANLLLNGVPGVCDKVATRKDFTQFLQALESRTSDAALVRPAFVKRVLASRACRYAIMFGDTLSQERCEELIRDLSKCDLCFICAHGRPSVVPLLDMRTLQD